MKIWKRNAVVAAIVLFVCVAVYLNWSYSRADAAGEDSAKTLGEAALISSETSPELAETQGAAEVDALAEIAPETGYFDTARLSRQQARDEALSILQATVDDPAAAAEAVSAASDSITAMAAATLAESRIEELVGAKSYDDCIAYIGDNSVSVVVSAAEDGLDATDVAKITDIVLGETQVSADQVKIIEAE